MNSKSEIRILVDRDGGRSKGRGIMFTSAHNITPEGVNVMARYGKGLVACCIEARRAYELGLQAMPGTTRRKGMPIFLVSVEAASCTGTGISVADRAETLNVLANPLSTPADICTPGHIMPCLIPEDPTGESLLGIAMNYMTECKGGSIIAWCDILDETGDIASADYCFELAEQHGLLAMHSGATRQILSLGTLQRAPAPPRYNDARPSRHHMHDVPLSGMIHVDPMLSEVR